MNAWGDPRRLARLAALAVVLVGAPAFAQTPGLILDCEPDEVDALTPEQIGAASMALYPDTLLARLESRLSAGDFAQAVATVREQFIAASPGIDQIDNGQFFVARLDSVGMRLGKTANVRIFSFNPIVDEFGETARIFGDAGARVIVLTEQTPAHERRAFCWSAISVGRIIDRSSAPALDSLVDRLDRVLSRWENYTAGGYSQYPWELFINGITTGAGPGIEPPRSQWIVVHPAVAVQVSGSGFSDLRRMDAVPVELLGYLRYNADRSTYLGGALAVTFSSDAGPGIGPMLHLGRSVSLGGSWVTGDEGGFSVLFSADLYKAVSGVPGQIQQRIRDLQGWRDAAAAAVQNALQ